MLRSCYDFLVSKRKQYLSLRTYGISKLKVQELPLKCAYDIYQISHNVIKNVSDICEQRKGSQYAQSDKSPHEETLHPWLSKMCTGQILIRLQMRRLT